MSASPHAAAVQSLLPYADAGLTGRRRRGIAVARRVALGPSALRVISQSASSRPAPTQTPLPYDVADADITRRKHRDNGRSEAANLRVRPHKKSLRESCYELIEASGEVGATLHEIAERLGAKVYSVSGRLSELKAAKRVFESGRERGNAAVLITAQVKERLEASAGDAVR